MLNGYPLTGGQLRAQDKGIKVNYSLESKFVRLGNNVLATRMKDSSGESVADVQLNLVRLWVKYRTSQSVEKGKRQH